jgi:aspartate aminotransferase
MKDNLYNREENMLSNVVKNIVPSGTVAINARVFEMKAEGTEIINLSVGEPDFNTPEVAKDGARRAMDENKTRYDKVPGLIELREEICRKLKEENNVEYTPDQIVVSNGAKQCITNTCFTLLNPGDEVLIPSPYWVSYPEIVKIAGGVPVFVETKRENDFKLTAAEIEQYSTGRTKMIILCNPSNPLGTVHTRKELEAIAEVCVRKNIYIMSDEVYETICFADEFVSMADISPESKDMTILINGLSKSVPMTGWRIGYTATTVEIAKAISAFQGHITSHPSMISQWAGVEALKKGRSYTDMMVKAYRERMEAAVAFLRKELPEVSFIEPKGAFYLFLDISCVEKALKATAAADGKMPQSGTDSYSTEFTMKLLNEKHTAIAPGAAFGKEGFIRVAYAADKETLLAGLERIKQLVKELM